MTFWGRKKEQSRKQQVSSVFLFPLSPVCYSSLIPFVISVCWFVRLSSSESEMRLYFRIVFWLMNICCGWSPLQFFAYGLVVVHRSWALKERMPCFVSMLLKQRRQPVSTRFCDNLQSERDVAEIDASLLLLLSSTQLWRGKAKGGTFARGHFVFRKIGSNFGTLCFSERWSKRPWNWTDRAPRVTSPESRCSAVDYWLPVANRDY